MKTTTTSPLALATAPSGPSLVSEAFEVLTESFEQFCLMAGIESLTQMMGEDVTRLAGERYEHCPEKPGYRWGTSKAQVGFHGGKIEVERPRVRSKATGKEMALPSWEEISAGGFLDQWAMNLMVMNVATRKFGRAVRLPEAGVPAQAGSGLSKSTVSRRFKALSQAKLDEWMSSDLSELDLVAIQIDGLHLDDHLLMIGAVGIEVSGQKHPLGVVATVCTHFFSANMSLCVCFWMCFDLVQPMSIRSTDMDRGISHFGDCRLDKTASFLHDRLVRIGPRGISARGVGGNRAGEVRIGRFLRNRKVTVDKIVEKAVCDTAARVDNQHILAIQDTTSFRDDGSGNSLVGHATIAVEAEQGTMLGLVDMHLIERSGGGKTPPKNRPLRDKQSHRWIESMQASAERLQSAALYQRVRCLTRLCFLGFPWRP